MMIESMDALIKTARWLKFLARDIRRYMFKLLGSRLGTFLSLGFAFTEIWLWAYGIYLSYVKEFISWFSNIFNRMEEMSEAMGGMNQDIANLGEVAEGLGSSDPGYRTWAHIFSNVLYIINYETLLSCGVLLASTGTAVLCLAMIRWLVGWLTLGGAGGRSS